MREIKKPDLVIFHGNPHQVDYLHSAGTYFIESGGYNACPFYLPYGVDAGREMTKQSRKVTTAGKQWQYNTPSPDAKEDSALNRLLKKCFVTALGRSYGKAFWMDREDTPGERE